MKRIGTAAALLIIAGLNISLEVRANATCTGVLAGSQVDGIQLFFVPPRTPKLSGGPSLSQMSRVVSKSEEATLTAKQPTTAATAKLTKQRAELLKGWLNGNAGASVPGWVSTAAGVFAPSAWYGVAADVILQLLNGAGDAGRVQLANLAGTVSEGGEVAAIEHIPEGATPKKYVFSYVYVADLNGTRTVTPLHTCVADVVVKP
jgi:hypothetical protein